MDVSTELWERVKSTFQQAVELDTDQRAGFLDEACRGTPRLRICVEELLDLDQETSPLPQGKDTDLRETARGAWEGERLGPYQLLECLGEGGMGTVFLAERVDGEFDQQVAIKLVGRGPSSPDLRRRFLAERQILARLEHRNIARLLDGGTTRDGVPFLVMERVEGEPITTACKTRNLKLEDRLQLLRQVCGAVEFAHHNLVVHRDLKPNNILVTADGTVKLLDFGIAKLLDDEPATQAATRLMTPRYASPEQLLGQPVTTACDVYGLGLVLYEIIAGCGAFEEAQDPIAERLASEGPLPPSHRGRKGQTARTRDRGLTDLDRIVLKALARDPKERYASAGALRADLLHYLRDEPLEAAPRDAIYRCRHFLRRHRVALGAAALVVLALAAGFVARSLEAQAARRAEQRAEAVADYLVDIFRDAGPERSRGDEVTARELLARGVERMDEFEGDPLVRARLLNTLANVYDSLGKYDLAMGLLEQALEINRQHLGEMHAEVGQTLFLLGYSQLNDSDYKTAVETLGHSAEIFERVRLPLKMATALDERGVALRELGRFAESEVDTRKALDLRQKFGAPPPDLASSFSHLGILFWHLDRLDEARPLLEETLAIRENHFGADHPHVAVTLNSLGILSAGDHDFVASRKYFERALALRERILGTDHPKTAQSLANLAALGLKVENFHEADHYSEKAVAVFRKSQGNLSPQLAEALSNRGTALAALERLEESEAALLEALAIQQETLGPNHHDLAETHMGLGRVSRRRGHWQEARRQIRRALEIRRQSLPPEHRLLALTEKELATLEQDNPDHQRTAS